MNLEVRHPIVPDELSRPIAALTPKPADGLMDDGQGRGSFDGGWMGMVSEFRNHLTIFLAGTNQLSAMLPRAVASEFADRLEDMESSAEFLQTLVTWMDASIGRGSQAISDVGDLLSRAEVLASTGLPSRVSVCLEPRPAGVRNRGVAIECGLAALITELGRGTSVTALGSMQPFEVRVSVHPQRGTLSIVISSNAEGTAKRKEDAWRVSLAKGLLAQVGGTVEPLERSEARGPGFEVRFRFQ